MRFAAYLVLVACPVGVVASAPLFRPSDGAADTGVVPTATSRSEAAARVATQAPTALAAASAAPMTATEVTVFLVRDHLVRMFGGKPSDWTVEVFDRSFAAAAREHLTPIRYVANKTGAEGYLYRDDSGELISAAELRRRAAATQGPLSPLERKTDSSQHAFMRAHAKDRVMLEFGVDVRAGRAGEVVALVESLGGRVVDSGEARVDLWLRSDELPALAEHEAVRKLHVHADTWALALRVNEPATRADLGAGPGRPYGARDILDAFQTQGDETGVDPLLVREPVAHQIADRLWTMDGRRYPSLEVTGTCAQVDRCSLEIRGTPAAAVAADIHRFTVMLPDLRVDVSPRGHLLSGVPPPLDSKVDALVRGLVRDGMGHARSVEAVRWLPPPDFGTFVVTYSDGSQVGARYRVATIDVASRRLVSFEDKEWHELPESVESEDVGQRPYRPLPPAPDAPVGYDADPSVVLLRATSDATYDDEEWPASFTLYGDGRAIYWRFRDLHGDGPCRPASAIPTMRVARLTPTQVETLLAYALHDGRLATARPTYRLGESSHLGDVDVFEIAAGGLHKTVTIADLHVWYDERPEDADAGGFLRLSRRLSDFGRDVASGAAADGGVYEPDHYQVRLRPVQEKPSFRPARWPWDDIPLAAFEAGDEGPPSLTMTAQQALRVCDIPWDPNGPEAAFDGVVVRGPDGRDYLVNIRPLLPGEHP